MARTNLQQINYWRRKHPLLFPFALFLLLAMISGLLGGQAAQRAKIGLLRVEGPIMDSSNFLSQIAILKQRPDVRGIIVRIDSPGGGAAASQEIYQALLDLAESKPLYTFIGSVGASGGYYIALAGKQIYALPSSLTGSIGVILQGVDPKGLMDKLGLKTVTLTAGRNKDMGDLSQIQSGEKKALWDSILQSTHDQFIQAVSDSRGIPKAKLANIADGRVFTGEQAKKVGLVDHLGGFSQVLSDLKKELNLPEDTEVYRPDESMKAILDEFAAQSMLTLFGSRSHGGLLYLATF